jgi:uncharacterized protein (TIGR02145 family)
LKFILTKEGNIPPMTGSRLLTESRNGTILNEVELCLQFFGYFNGSKSIRKYLFKGEIYLKTNFKQFIITFCFIFLLAVNASAVVPSAPILTATTSGLTVSFSWDAVAGATSYILYYAPYPAATPIGSANMGTQTSLSVTLTEGAAYYVAVRANNSSGSSGYSNILSFTIQNSTSSSTVTDNEGNVYNTVTIGSQTWMKENLRTTKYRDGTAIGTITSTNSIKSEVSPKYQWVYLDNESNASTYGRLYTWYAATDSRGLCPANWHLPTDAEWTTLIDYLGGDSVAGGKMKEVGTTHWTSPNTGADNSSGFTGLPGSYHSPNGQFVSGGSDGYWWSASDYTKISYAWYRNLSMYSGTAWISYSSKQTGMSIRCIMD